MEDETYVSTPAKQFNSDLCYVCQERSRIELSRYCKFCDYKFHHPGKELKKPERKELVYCKVFECSFGAAENGLCIRRAACVRQQPAAVAAVVAPAAPVKPVS